MYNGTIHDEVHIESYHPCLVNSKRNSLEMNFWEQIEGSEAT